jgi:hypothetical protein
MVFLIAASRLTGGWVFGDSACKASLFLTVNTAFIKIVLMAIISLDRYLNIVRRYRVKTKLSYALLGVTVAFVSSTTAAVSIPNIFSQRVEYANDSFTICTVAFDYQDTSVITSIFFAEARADLPSLDDFSHNPNSTISLLLIPARPNKSLEPNKALRSWQNFFNITEP